MAPWHLPLLVERLAEVLEAQRGLDRDGEVALQALLADGLAAHHGTARERSYPSWTGKRSHRPRCDLVLTPRGARLAEEAPTLLDALGPPPCPPEEALWLELKVAHQLGEGGRHRARYAQQWRRSLFADVRKLRADPRVRHAALALIAFNDAQETFDRDVETFERLLFDEGLVTGYRSARSFAIDDRIGHTRCSVAAWPL